MAACSQRCRSKRSSSFKFLFCVRAIASESETQDLDLWAAVRTVMVAEEEGLAPLLDHKLMRDLVRHQVAVALAIEHSLDTDGHRGRPQRQRSRSPSAPAGLMVQAPFSPSSLRCRPGPRADGKGTASRPGQGRRHGRAARAAAQPPNLVLTGMCSLCR